MELVKLKKRFVFIIFRDQLIHKNPTHTVQDYTCDDSGDLKKQNVNSEGQKVFWDVLVC